jgi:hypothetical protein
MSSCRSIKSRTVLGLATLATVQSIPARHASSNSRSLILVRSQNKPSSAVALPAAQPSIRSRIAAPSTNASFAISASSSMPKKTESSILKHVERVSI